MEDRVREFRCECESLLSILPPLLVKTLEKSQKTVDVLAKQKQRGLGNFATLGLEL